MSKDAAIHRLRDANLLVDKWEDGTAYSGGYSVAKPANVPGNNRGYECTYWSADDDGDDIQVDGPRAIIYPQNKKWIFQIHEYAPGPGPGDFEKEYDSLKDAVDAVMDYYFGDPFLMNPPDLKVDSFWEMLKTSPTVAGTRCKHETCTAERVKLSAFCRAHHFEKMRGEPPPYD